MESNIKSSFIPRDTAETLRPRRKRGGGVADLAVLFSIVLVVASVALGVSVFLYVKFLQSSLSSKQEQLKRAQASFEPALIGELNRLDDRMRTAEDLLAQHLAPSILLKVLEDLTLNTVSFKSLKYTVGEKSGIALDFTGIARSVNSIALQADLFGKHGVIGSPIFSNINRQPEGVAFELTAVVNPKDLKYQTLIQPETPPPTQDQSSAPGQIPGFTQ
ncbi:hypothetical protein HY413_01090 [Candidatus Kaiserbacteria bacterium]|nr:hypothetical protein [Candidatus Kaiserbacteria bacterium]